MRRVMEVCGNYLLGVQHVQVGQQPMRCPVVGYLVLG